MNEMEYCAYGVFWKAIGDAMGIQYDGLLAGAKDGWKDGVAFADDIAAWAKLYEINHMKPNTASAKSAEALVPMMTHLLPSFLKPMASECISSLMGERIRDACL